MQNQTMVVRQDRSDARATEQYLEIGNRLHDQAVVDFFYRMVSGALLSMRKGFGSVGGNHRDHRGGAGSPVKQASRIPV